jgi:hypothetical protein
VRKKVTLVVWPLTFEQKTSRTSDKRMAAHVYLETVNDALFLGVERADVRDLKWRAR